MKKEYNFYNTIFESLKFGFPLLKKQFIIMQVVSLLFYSFPVVGIILNKNIFDSVNILPDNTNKLLPLIFLITMYFLYLLINRFHLIYYTRYLLQYGNMLKFEKLSKIKLHEKCDEINGEKYEDSSLYREILKARNASQNVYRIIEIFIYIIGLSFGSVFIFLNIKSFNPYLLIFVLLNSFAIFFENFITGKKISQFKIKNAQKNREFEGINDLFIKYNSNRELKVFNIMTFVKNKWNEKINYLIEEEKLLNRSQIFLVIFSEIIKFISQFGAYFLSGYLFINQKISLGEFTASLVAFSSLVNFTNEFFELTSFLNRFVFLVKPFFNFMNIRHNKRNEINDKKFKNIKLNNVSFIYPNTNKKAVNNINIEINKGDKIALVGENGSGKSTLIKLILGLYTPTEGNVLYNGEKSKGIDKKDLYSDKSVVFQDFNRYFMSVYENVLMGNYCENNRQEIVQSLIKSGFPLNKFSLEDNLGREFGGIELSGGEWQKLSIARGFFKRSEMIVFDEPTSAIDPFQESKLYEKFFELFSKKTMLLVTHRLGAIKLVDKIIVLNDGKIIETGTHEELINRDGYYNKLWSSQTKWYDLNYDS